LKSRLDEFLGLLSSFVPIKVDARRIMNNSNWKFGNSALLCLLNQRLFSRWSGLLHNATKHWSWEFGSLRSHCILTVMKSMSSSWVIARCSYYWINGF
jgi:hypothetical protein